MEAQSLAITWAEGLSDEEVVARVVAGDAGLFELLMRRYNQRVYRCVRGIVGDESEAEDVMQQAYVNAYANLASFAGRSAFSTWLTRIAMNEALARVRTRPVQLVSGKEETMERTASTEPDPEARAAATEMRRLVETEVAALPPAYRSVLLMREVEGLSTAETAECLGLGEDAIKTRLHRARIMLRDALFKRAGVTLEGIFTFGAARCDRVVATVLSEIARQA